MPRSGVHSVTSVNTPLSVPSKISRTQEAWLDAGKRVVNGRRCVSGQSIVCIALVFIMLMCPILACSFTYALLEYRASSCHSMLGDGASLSQFLACPSTRFLPTLFCNCLQILCVVILSLALLVNEHSLSTLFGAFVRRVGLRVRCHALCGD